MVREHGPALFDEGTATRRAAERVAGRTFEFGVFLRDELGVDIGAALKIDEPTTFHYACHARPIDPVAGLEVTLRKACGEKLKTPVHAELCCGFGGVFAVDLPEVSGAMLDAKLAELRATGATLCVCNEAGCGMQLRGGAARNGLDLRFRHIAELLAESLGLMEREA